MTFKYGFNRNFAHVLTSLFSLISFSVLMKGITWSRDSHGLFDYESRHLTKKTLKASYESMIMRSGNDLSLNRYNSMRSFQEQCDAKKQMPEDMAMLKIVNRSNTFYLESATYQPHHVDIERNEQNGKSQESMYLVVRSLKVNNEKIVSVGHFWKRDDISNIIEEFYHH